jgi:hypothetical protein
MSFVRSKSTLGPRGRNVSAARGARVQGYVGDDHSFTRGPGAIAALDGASSRRRMARARALGADAALDAARARVASGARPRAGNGQAMTRGIIRPTVLPGVRITNIVRPGSIAVAKYPGIPGYQGHRTYGGQVMTGGRTPGGGGRAGDYSTSGEPTVQYGGGYGPPQTGVTIGTPQAGGVSTPSGQIDPSTGGSGGGSSGGGGGGGGGDYGTPGDPGGGGPAPMPDPGTPTDDGSAAPDDAAPGDGAGGGAQPDVALTPMVGKPGVSTTISPGTRNWIIAGAALFGAYLLFKD